MKRSRIGTLVASIALTLATSAGTVSADEVRLMAVNALKEPLQELASGFERSTGHKVVLIGGGTEGITKRIAGGEAADVVIVAAPNIDRLIADGKLLAGTRTDVAKVGVGVAVRSGLPRPDVSSADAVKRAVLEAKSVAYSSGPSGFYLAELFKRMGIADEIKGKVRQPESGVQVGELVARGEADLGFQQVSELIHVKGIDYLGPLPAEIQNITTYSAALAPGARSPEAAKALVKHLTAPDAAPVMRKAALEPG